MAIMKDQEHVLNDRLRERIKGVVKNDQAFGAIRGMIYNNLQQWKMKLFEANCGRELFLAETEGGSVRSKDFDAGDVYELMRLTQVDKEFMLETLLDIDDLDVSDEFLMKIAEKTLNKLNAVKSPTAAQEGLKADMIEALSGKPF